jgi:hypothetical protein
MGNIRLLSILNEVLNEVGDLQHVEPSPYSKSSESTYNFSVNLDGEDVPGEVVFQSIDKYVHPNDLKVTSRIFRDNFSGDLSTIFNVGYQIGGKTTQYQKSDIKNLYIVMKTVVEIIKDFIKTNQPFGVVFFEDNKNSEVGIDKQKRLFNHAISKNHLPSNYRMEEGKIGETEMTIIYKSKME